MAQGMRGTAESDGTDLQALWNAAPVRLVGEGPPVWLSCWVDLAFDVLQAGIFSKRAQSRLLLGGQTTCDSAVEVR